jgi:hypothetical protein
LRKYIVIFTVLLLTAGLFAMGCGGSSDGAETKQIDKATFVRQANKICQQISGRLAAQIASINKREQGEPDYDFTKTQIALVSEALVPGLEDELQQIRALGVPKEAKKEAQTLLAAYQKGIDRTKANVKAWIEKEGYAPYEVAELAAVKLGISECPIAPVTNS